MKLVIDIDEEIYLDMKEGDFDYARRVVRSLQATIASAIITGTPLPKGHGDLIDRNDLLEYTDSNICAYTPTINRYDIITAPTIIETDKGE